MKPISKNQKLKTKKYFAFTIVELIIVVAILAVVATISFVSYNSYNTTSRDSARIIDITSITSGLNQYVYKGGTYPMPEGIISSGTINGLSVAYKGEIRDGIARLAGLSKALKDPLTNGYYVYGVSFNKKYFQIGVTLEDSNSVAYIKYKIENNNSFIHSPLHSGRRGIAEQESVPWGRGVGGEGLEQTFADNSTASYSTKVSGNYLGLIKFNTGSSVYLANIPSLIFNFSGSNVYSGNLLISSGVYFVIDKNTNYPYALNSSMNINNKDGNTILQSITNNSGATLTGVDITSITNSTGTVSSLFSGSVLSSFGYSLDVITSAVGVSNVNSNIVVTNTNCSSTTYSGYTISALNNGSSQTFTKTISNGTGSILATCNSTVLSYGAESIVCSSSSTKNGNYCIYNYFPGEDGTGGTVDDCNTVNITLGNGQIWAACNLGAKTAYNGSNGGSYVNSATRGGDDNVNGKIYQWGRNKGFSSSDTSQLSTQLSSNPNGADTYNFVWNNPLTNNDWLNPQIHTIWGGATTDSGTYDGQTDDTLRQGPCPYGRHIPSAKEWQDACNYITSTTCTNGMSNTTVKTTLLLPYVGNRYWGNGQYYYGGSYGWYWSSSPHLTSTNLVYTIGFDGTMFWPYYPFDRAYGIAIRCIAN